LFEIFLTDEARNQLEVLKKEKALRKDIMPLKKLYTSYQRIQDIKALKPMNSPALSDLREKKSLKPMPNNPLLLHIEFSGTMGLIKTRSRSLQ
jgi:hypothetical protein